MSRRNTRQGKARRRGERDRRQVTERERKRPGIPSQDPQAVDDQAVQAALPVDPGEAELGTDADMENADPVDLSDLDPDDADLQAVLAEEDLGEGDLGDVGEVV